ncbi:MAG: dihydrolipoyl dehydrogenase [Ignavibacteria bacterium]
MRTFDITVIGSGPGGYTAAIRAAQLGFTTAIVERDKLGGVCLNWGCIPTKALLKDAELFNTLKKIKEHGINVDKASFELSKIIDRSRKVALASERGVQYLMKKNNITVINGSGYINKDKTILIKDKSGKELEKISSKHIIIATGARPRALGNLQFDEEIVLSSTGAMLKKELPRKITIVGSGAIGMEFAYFYNAFGSEVTIIEMLPQVLPVEDTEIADVVAKEFKKNGIKIYTDTKTETVEVKNGKAYTTVSGKTNETFESDVVLIAIGVVANKENLGLEELGVEMYKNGIKVDRNYRTNIENIYAIGDVALINPAGKPWLAHVASAEGINCVEKIKGIPVANIEYDNIPGCTYCQPQVASVGLTEKEAREKGYELKVGKFPFSANGKSRATGETIGMVKLIFDAKYGELLGGHIVGNEATELISELVTLKSLEGTGESLIKIIHAHPSLSEAILEAAGVAFGEAINI